MLKQIDNTVVEMTPEEEATYIAALAEVAANDTDDLAEAAKILMGVKE